jgi:peptidyl-prolyl cis-trans isomerase-like 1
VELTISLGSVQQHVTLELYVNHAPKTCHNFLQLARRGFYDGTIVRATKTAAAGQPPTPRRS